MENHALKYCDDCIGVLSKLSEKQKRGAEYVHSISHLKQKKELEEPEGNILEDYYSKLLTIAEHIKINGQRLQVLSKSWSSLPKAFSGMENDIGTLNTNLCLRISQDIEDLAEQYIKQVRYLVKIFVVYNFCIRVGS